MEYFLQQLSYYQRKSLYRKKNTILFSEHSNQILGLFFKRGEKQHKKAKISTWLSIQGNKSRVNDPLEFHCIGGYQFY